MDIKLEFVVTVNVNYDLTDAAAGFDPLCLTDDTRHVVEQYIHKMVSTPLVEELTEFTGWTVASLSVTTPINTR